MFYENDYLQKEIGNFNKNNHIHCDELFFCLY